MVRMGGRGVVWAALVCLLAGSAEGVRSRDSGRLWVDAQSRHLRKERSTLTRVARGALPAVVSITTRQPTAETALSAEEPQRGIGSGFVIHPDGYILTSAHVVEGASEVQVTLLSPRGLREEYLAEVVGMDARTDFALLKIDAPRKLPILKLATAAQLEVADWVVVIGNPFGLQHSVTVGVVSFKGRTDVTPNGRDGDFDYIQTDASINPGNSGGPVLNLRGEVVAIANAVNVAGQGIGFAIPIDIAKAVVPHLKAHGRVRRGWMGISVQDASAEVAAALALPRVRGIVVTDVVEGGPGAHAGLQVGDIIYRLNGRSITRAHALRWQVATRGVGKRVSLEVRRNGRPVRLRVKLAELPAEEAAPPKPQLASLPHASTPSLGARVEDLHPDAERLPDAASLGALIRAVEPDSVMETAGVSAGDVILQVNESDVGSREDFLQRLRDIASGETVRLSVRRGARTLALAFRKP